MKFLGYIFNRRVMAVLGLIALALIIWFLGPLLAFAEWRPLDSALVRAIVIAAVVLFYIGRWTWRLWEAKRQKAQLAEGVVAQNAPPPAPTPSTAGVQEKAGARP